jgi:L-rhamnose mutarotase
MTVKMIVRRKADYQDARLVPLRREGITLLKKHGATSHSYGYYHSGPHAGQMFVVIDYPDVAAHERAMASMQQDVDWQRVASELEKLAPLQELSVAVITEQQ